MPLKLVGVQQITWLVSDL